MERINKVSLRPYQVSDVDDFWDWVNDDEVLKLSRFRRFTSREDALCYLKKNALLDPWLKAICVDGLPLGFVAFEHAGSAEYIGCRGTIGASLGRKYWGKGIATLAMRMHISAVFQHFTEIQRVEAITAVDHPAMHRVLEKIGFHKEGLLRNYVVAPL